MAWIGGLADKAENILNKLDKNAATALSQVPNDAISEMRKSLSSGALKTLSPNKSNKNILTPGNTFVPSATNTAASSRRNSTDSKTGAITINVESIENQGPTNVGTSMSASFTEQQELAAFKIALADITAERDELRSRVFNLESNEQNNQIYARIQELETLVQCLHEERENLQQETIKLQTANSSYAHSISELEANFAKLQQEYIETAQKLQIVIKQTDHQRQDFQEYRLKAQNTLQMKDNLIAELKTNSLPTTKTSTNTQNDIHVLQLENDAIREELRNTKDERQTLQNQLEQLQQQWLELGNEHERQLNEMRANEIVLRKELRLERERMLANESEQRVLTQELYTLRHQYNQHIADAKARLQEKEHELQKLKNTPMESSRLNNSFNDTETRLKTLTQALVEKQNKVENITAERNALKIQLEKLQEKHVNYVQSFQINKNTRNALLSNSTDDAKAQFPMLLTPSPFDNRVARRVKRAYTSLDSAGVRLGSFLRRYPLMRIFVLMYVALLHIWVIFVLLSSTPN